jgi:hypothetical protein
MDWFSPSEPRNTRPVTPDRINTSAWAAEP